MNDVCFDRLTKAALRPGLSRRAVGRLIAGAALADGLRRHDAALARRAATPPACLGSGKRCRHGDRCCSGLCHKGKCRPAPGQGQCTILEDVCGETGSVLCNAVGADNCLCVVTTRGASFCANVIDRVCATCATDADCRQLLTAPDAVCAHNVNTACCDAGQNACVRPCANPA